MGMRMPVDSKEPYAKAKPVTINTAIPLIPDLAIPRSNAQLTANKKPELNKGRDSK